MTLRPVTNPPNPWHSQHVEWLGEPPDQRLEVYEEEAKSIVSENESPDLGFRYSLNPYRGCFHACAYCYARPTHQHLGFGAGTDFDRRIVVKVNAAELLRRHFERASWQGDTLVFSGVTDCYQPLESHYGVTRACLEVALRYRNPVGVITKSALVQRDAELLGELARVAHATVYVSIPFADDAMARAIEPNAPSPTLRFAALRALAAAGVETGVAIAPLIPGLNDSHVPEILARAHAAGARRAFHNLLRLPAEVAPVFLERIREALPLRAARIESALREVRGGRLNESAFHERMRGHGPRWQAIRDLFQVHARRLGFAGPSEASASTFRRPAAQGMLFAPRDGAG